MHYCTTKHEKLYLFLNSNMLIERESIKKYVDYTEHVSSFPDVIWFTDVTSEIMWHQIWNHVTSHLMPRDITWSHVTSHLTSYGVLTFFSVFCDMPCSKSRISSLLNRERMCSMLEFIIYLHRNIINLCQ